MQASAANEELSVPQSMVSKRMGRLRLLVGLLQGVVLYALYLSVKSAAWPASNSYLFASLLLVSLFVPVLFISALGHLETRRIWLWMAVAALVAIVLGIYDIWRQGFPGRDSFGLIDGMPGMFPSAWVLVFVALGFCVAHALVLAAAADRRYIARYSSYFELAWKLTIQISFSLLFIGVLWLILWLGAALFMLVKLGFLQDLLRRPWFFIPVTAFAFSTALHITDVRPGIVRGIRNLLLVLMSWLLPVTTLIVGGFLASLPLVGLEPLWATRHASSVLLTAAAVLVLLINAAFQNGEAQKDVAPVLRGSARLACVLLLPISLIAIYSLALRVQQYGWTSDRIIAAACLLIACCYACGYTWAALERGTWLARIAPVNVLTAFVLLAVLLALFTPIADPARLSVVNQLARLESGKVDAEKFDFAYLRFEGARYGNEALHKLKNVNAGADAALLNKRAEEILLKKNRWDRAHDRVVADAPGRAANITVWPAGMALPISFLEQNWGTLNDQLKDRGRLPQCLLLENKKCDAYQIDLNGDDQTEILMRETEGYADAVVFALEADGKWQPSGRMSRARLDCKDVAQALEQGQYEFVAPRFREMQVAGQRLYVQPWPSERTTCAKAGKQ